MRIVRFSALLGAGLLLALAPSQVFATCPGFSQSAFHGFGGNVDNCVDNRPVSAYAYVNAGPGVTSPANSAGIQISCNVANVLLLDQNLLCQAAAGVAGDGKVTINMNWGSPGVNGCPNTTGTAGQGRNVVVITDNEGKTATLEVGYNTIIAGYVMEAVNNGTSPPRNGAGNAVCSRSGEPTFVADNDLGGGAREVVVGPPATLPVVFSDCDPGADGASGSCAGDTTTPPSQIANTWSVIAPCSGSPRPDLVGGGWTDHGPFAIQQAIPYTDADVSPVCVAGDPALVGNACAADSDCNGGTGGGQCDNRCVYAAFNYIVDAVPGPAGSCFMGIVCTAGPNAGLPCPGGDADCGASVPGTSAWGTLQVAGGPLAASDRAVARLAELGKNVLRVEFNVSLEQNARSFDILAGGQVINDSPILAENRGTYVASIDKAGGKLKGAKEITVRTNLDGGGAILSDPLSIKKGK
jgi:hypothetical protein